MKIDFGKFPMFTGIKRDKTVQVNIKESLADLIYTKVSGVKASSLAHRIYETDGELELSANDVEVLQHCTELFTGVMSDSLLAALQGQNNEQSK